MRDEILKRQLDFFKYSKLETGYFLMTIWYTIAKDGKMQIDWR